MMRGMQIPAASIMMATVTAMLTMIPVDDDEDEDEGTNGEGGRSEIV